MITFKSFLKENKTGHDIADIMTHLGYKIKKVTKGTVVVLTKNNRLSEMQKVVKELESSNAMIDRSLKGSSIGGIIVGKVKILFKSEGKTGGLDVEEAAINALQSAIDNAIIENEGNPITIKIKDRNVGNITGVRKTPGTPKSDFHLINSAGETVVHISHKKGVNPTDFNQWGGVTEKAIADHPEVKQFAQDCKKRYNDKILNRESAFKKIKDDHLKKMSIYGVNYKKNGVDVNKVDVVIQGDPGLIKNGKHFELTASGNIHYLGDKIGGGFEPVLSIIYKGDRDNFGIKGARASIYPIEGRKFKEELK